VRQSQTGTCAAVRANNLRAPPFQIGPFTFQFRRHEITELVLHRSRLRTSAAKFVRSACPFALRTIVELKTDSGHGFSETYGGDGPLAGLESVRTRVIGMDLFNWRRCGGI
jgi:hypothetical protein